MVYCNNCQYNILNIVVSVILLPHGQLCNIDSRFTENNNILSENLIKNSFVVWIHGKYTFVADYYTLHVYWSWRVTDEHCAEFTLSTLTLTSPPNERERLLINFKKTSLGENMKLLITTLTFWSHCNDFRLFSSSLL